jgi:hypothetical protein
MARKLPAGNRLFSGPEPGALPWARWSDSLLQRRGTCQGGAEREGQGSHSGPGSLEGCQDPGAGSWSGPAGELSDAV